MLCFFENLSKIMKTFFLISYNLKINMITGNETTIKENLYKKYYISHTKKLFQSNEIMPFSFALLFFSTIFHENKNH